MRSKTLDLIRENSRSLGDARPAVVHLSIDVERAYAAMIEPWNNQFFKLCGQFIEATRDRLPTIRIGHWLLTDEKPYPGFVHASPGTPEYQSIFPDAPPRAGDKVLFKPAISPFARSDLHEHIPLESVILISGAFASLTRELADGCQCVDAAIEDAQALGYQVAVVRDLLFPMPRRGRYAGVEDVLSAHVLEALAG
jgi:hypothetical protein